MSENKVAANALVDKIVQKSTQLDAMLTIITGEGYETFSAWSDETKHNYLWACSSMSQSLGDLSHELSKLNAKY